MRSCCLLLLLATSLQADERLPNGVLARLGSLGMRHHDCVTALALSPDGKLLASAGDDKTLRLWNVETGEDPFSTEGASGVINVHSSSGDVSTEGTPYSEW